MKKLYSIIALIIFSVFHSQIVNIPDPVFKAKLLSANNTTNYQIAMNSSGQYIKIDANSNGEIEVSEANNVKYLTISDSFITDLTGIQSFSNLSSLSLFGFDAQTVDVSGMPSLEFLKIQALDQLTSLNITNCTSLENINITSCSALLSLSLASSSVKNITLFGGNLNQLDVTNCTALEGISIQATKITDLDLSNLTFLKNVNLLSNSQLQNVNFQGSTKLYTISIVSCKVSTVSVENLPELWKLTCNNDYSLHTINATNCAALERLELAYNNLSNLNINNLPSLLILDVSDNNLSSIDVTSLSTLQLLRCNDNQLQTLDLNQNPALSEIYCQDNLLQELDLSQNPSLWNIECGNNNLHVFNIKNGVQSFPANISISNNPQLQFFCCDDINVTYFTNMLSNYGYNNVVVNSYCSFTPGGTFYTVQGNTKYDNNNNGCDINDLNKALQQFSITNGTVTGNIIANNSGDYSIAVGAGSHTITPVLENPAYFTISPSSLTANFPTQASPLTQNFCLTANGVHNDLETVIIPVTSAVPGFEAKYKIVFKNKGTTTQSGTLAYNFNDNLMNYLSATVNPNTQSTGSLVWNFSNLLPFESKEIIITFTLNTPVQTPPLNGGDVLHYTAEINGATDDTPADNIFTLNQTVVNSFDPNDKTCLEGASIAQTQVGDYVHYLIRFENTGNGNAHNIVVKDEIDVTKFDLSTIVPLNASHSFVTRIANPNIVEFIFENIQLPFDDANNDGYVSFKIKTKSNLVIGDSFSNTAKIYFDYNAPIITNTYTTAVQQILALDDVKKAKNNTKIYPNPVRDIIYIQSEKEIVKAEIYDTTGRIVMTIGVKDNSINVSELSNANYIIKLFSKDQVMVQQFIKK